MRTQGSGNIVVVGSVIGHVAVPDMAAYVISKWGVRALVRQLQVDNRDRPGIRIEYVAPGGVDTPIYRQAATYGDAAGRPPFPVTSPERIADRALAVADGRRSGGQVGLANEVIRFGFTAFPWAYDRLVGPLFSVAAQDQTVEVSPARATCWSHATSSTACGVGTATPCSPSAPTSSSSPAGGCRAPDRRGRTTNRGEPRRPADSIAGTSVPPLTPP